jgi:hypothetical protein
VQVLLKRTAEWKEHEHEAELKDVKPLVLVEEEEEGACCDRHH